MTSHGKKMIAPIIIALSLISYYIIVLAIMIRLALPGLVRIAVAVGSLGISVALIWVLIDRIKEIRKGEEDDLSKY